MIHLGGPATSRTWAPNALLAVVIDARTTLSFRRVPADRRNPLALSTGRNCATLSRPRRSRSPGPVRNAGRPSPGALRD